MLIGCPHNNNNNNLFTLNIIYSSITESDQYIRELCTCSFNADHSIFLLLFDTASLHWIHFSPLNDKQRPLNAQHRIICRSHDFNLILPPPSSGPSDIEFLLFSLHQQQQHQLLCNLPFLVIIIILLIKLITLGHHEEIRCYSLSDLV